MIKPNIVILLILFPLFYSGVFSQDTTAILQNDTIDPYYLDSVNLDLLIASESGNINSLLESIRSGADVNTSTYQGVTPLMYAAQANNIEILKILLHNGADPNIRPANGKTALISAAIFNNTDIAEMLIQYGADIDTCDDYSVNPLIYAAAYGYYILTDMLIYYGAEIDKRDADSTNAIIIAALNGKTNIVDLLIQKGVDINSSDKNDFTPLIVAVQNGHYDVVKLLLENGSYVNAKTNFGTTPLYYAANNGYTDIVQLLIENNANVNEKVLKEKSLSTLPNIYNYPIIRKKLKQNGLKMNYWPAFNSLIIGYGFNFNNKDILSGAVVGVNDYKLNIGMSIGYEMRYWEKRTLVESKSNFYYQFREKRSSAYFALEKRFSILTRLKSKTGYLLGGKVLYTFGSYRGSSIKPDGKFKFTPQAGFYYSMKYFAAKLLYEYIDYDIYKVSPHRINIQLLLKLDLIRYNKYEKEVNWLTY